MPLISIVLATYNRPESLKVAIRSVLLQTVQDWRLLVVGDACDERTAAVVATFADARIKYVNLPSRCGEQAIPNSIGMALADGDYIALLNHDDVLLADHLAQALARLEASGADLFVGRAAFARASALSDDGRRLPVFSELTPIERGLHDVFCIGCEVFEPCSAWVFRRALFARVGPWQAAATLYRAPMEDWLLRAWRAGARLVQSADITVLRMLTHYQQPKDAHAYDWGHGEPELLEELICNRSPGFIRTAILQRLEIAVLGGAPRPGFAQILPQILGALSEEQEWLAARFLTPAMAEVYLRTGWDAFGQFCLLAGLGKGQSLRIALRKRTGEELPPAPDYAALLAFAQRELGSAQ